MESEDGLAFPRALRHAGDRAVAVFDGEGEFAFLRGATHAGVFAFGHAAFEDQPFGAAADAGKKRFDQHATAVRAGAEFGLTGGCAPKSLCCLFCGTCICANMI